MDFFEGEVLEFQKEEFGTEIDVVDTMESEKKHEKSAKEIWRQTCTENSHFLCNHKEQIEL
jgi:hypothetical protein